MNFYPPIYPNLEYYAHWTYYSPDQKPLIQVVRYTELDGGKKVIPYTSNGLTWQAGGTPTSNRPLYGLQLLASCSSNEPIYIVEGEKCAAALQSLGFIATTSIGGGQSASKTDWTPLSGFNKVYIIPDNDECGKKYTTEVSSILVNLAEPPEINIVRIPNLPEKGDIVDWLQRMLPDWDGIKPIPMDEQSSLVREFEELIKEESEVVCPAKRIGPWQEPLPLSSDLNVEWPIQAFSYPLDNFIKEVSISTETPIELAAMGVLSTLSTAAQGKYHVIVEVGYTEPLSIWTCTALLPGNRKTAVHNLVTAPLKIWEQEKLKEISPLISVVKSQQKTIELRIRELRSKAAKTDDLVKRSQLLQDIEDEEKNMPESINPPQIWATDTTPENLAMIMANNDERMGILSDEGGIFDILSGMYSKGVANIDIFLQGHSGSSTRVNRIGRDPILLHRPALAIGLTPQPSVLQGLANQPSFRGRGLLARFLFALPKSKVGYRSLDQPALSESVKTQYNQLLQEVLNHPWYTTSDGEKNPYPLKLDTEAKKEWKRFSLQHEKNLRPDGMFAHISDWASKLPGAIIRIAGLLHVARYAMDEPWMYPIEKQDMLAAIDVAQVLSKHALAVFDLIGADPAISGAQAILNWIKDKELSSFTWRDCQHALKNKFHCKKEMQPAMEALIERDFIREKPKEVKSCRPSQIFEVNPFIFQGKDRIKKN